MAKYVGFKIVKVHESRVISEYYCGGCGWPVTDHDSFCPECGGAFRECDASNLEAENAKLKQELEAVGTAAYLYGRNDLKAENVKLREESSKYHDLYVHAIADAEVWHLQWSAEHQENAKLRELCRDFRFCKGNDCLTCEHGRFCDLRLNERCDELGVEVAE